MSVELCEGCGSAASLSSLGAAGHVACCPERLMVPAESWRLRALEAERKLKAAEQGHELEGGTVKKWFVIVAEPGLIAEKKGPWSTHEDMIRFLRDLVLHFDSRRQGTRVVVAQLTWNDDLWLSEAGDVLAEEDLLNRRKETKAAWAERRAAFERIMKRPPACKPGSEVAYFIERTRAKAEASA